MKRLTHERSNGIKTGYWCPARKEELVRALAAYEDTGLTPQEIYSLKAGSILKLLGKQWIHVEERLPDNDDYILMSFENFSLPLVGRYEMDETGGAFYVGDDEESCISQNLFVNAWMPLPEPYRPQAVKCEL